ncbi:LysR family transcriptional regulator [Bacillus pacificus]
MEMRHVKTFCAIVKYGGFSKAAHALGYAQSTVTAHMKALENDLHIPLFDRLGKKKYFLQKQVINFILML